MKMILLFISIFLFSCEESVLPSKEIIIDGVKWRKSVGSDGHDYIHNGKRYTYACMHYVDCELCKQRREKLEPYDTAINGNLWRSKAIF